METAPSTTVPPRNPAAEDIGPPNTRPASNGFGLVCSRGPVIINVRDAVSATTQPQRIDRAMLGQAKNAISIYDYQFRRAN